MPPSILIACKGGGGGVGVGGISIPHKLCFLEISPPQSLIQNSILILNLIY